MNTPLSERDEARFWSKVAPPNEQGCMLWLGALDTKGYARLRIRGPKVRAHRLSYELAYGPIPEGLQIDHVRARGCQHRHCVAPLHLEAVTQQENIRRGDVGKASAARQLAKTHCPQGHPYNDKNTYVTARGDRKCRECHRMQSLAAYHRKAA